MAESLPHEIMLNILSRLPVTSLVLMKRVCRVWRNLLQDPQLVCMHYLRAARNDPCLILQSDCPIQNQFFLIDVPSVSPNNEMAKRIDAAAMPEIDIVGSCNGLLCFHNLSDNSVHVCNPFTRAYMQLPKSTHDSDQEVVFGFGFNPRTKEYKVIKIVYYTNASKQFIFQPGERLPVSEVQILTVGSLTWRSLGEMSFHIRNTKQILLNGRLHWISWLSRFSHYPILISFDLEDEKFQLVQKPCGLSRCGYQLVVLGGCLSAVSFCNNGNMEIWMMKEYGIEESWVKEYSIGQYLPSGLEEELDASFKISKFYLNSGFVRVLCLLNNGELLLEYECRTLVSYDPKHGTFKDLFYKGMPDLFETTLHVGSLNWIDSVIDI